MTPRSDFEKRTALGLQKQTGAQTSILENEQALRLQKTATRSDSKNEQVVGLGLVVRLIRWSDNHARLVSGDSPVASRSDMRYAIQTTNAERGSTSMDNQLPTTPNFLIVTTKWTTRFTRALVDMLEPRDLLMYFDIDASQPNIVTLTRSDMPTPIVLNASSQFVGSRKLADALLGQGFEMSARYAVELSEDTRTLTLDTRKQTVGSGLSSNYQGKGRLQLDFRDNRIKEEQKQQEPDPDKISRIFRMMHNKRLQDAREERDSWG
jgi:hypothetical protein